MSPFQAYPLMWMITKISTPSNNQCSTWRQMVKIRGVRLMAAARNKLTTYAHLSLCSFVLALIFAPLRLLLLLFVRHQSPQLWRKHPSGSSSFNACNALDFLTTEHPKVMSTLPISSSSTHGYGSNTVSVPLVRRHVTICLKAARQECDKELQRVTNAITSFFEEKLHEGELSSSYETGSDGGYEAEPEGNNSRQSSLASSSPGVIRRQATISWDKKPAPSPPSAPNSAVRSFQAGEGTTSPRKQSSATNTSWSSNGVAYRRLLRSIHIPIRPTRSGHSSHSTRSRSPLPPNNHSSFSKSLSNPASSSNRRSSHILIDNPVDPIMNKERRGPSYSGCKPLARCGTTTQIGMAAIALGDLSALCTATDWGLEDQRRKQIQKAKQRNGRSLCHSYHSLKAHHNLRNLSAPKQS
ncbi:hypothetical protein F5888DRAFT_1640815 [Russula emetica]|nr:hypothetical protein F5888DRAFT_1640815 [Russula emetica]